MGQSGKKRYVKPTIKKVKLDTKCAALSSCKVRTVNGPGRGNCGGPVGSPCLTQGS